MRPWFLQDKLKIAVLALVTGLVVGGIVTYASRLGSQKAAVGASEASVAEAIAGDKATPVAGDATPAVKAPPKAKKKLKAKRAAKKASRRTRRVTPAPAAPPADTDSPEATPTPDSDVKAEQEKSPVTPVATPRRDATQRVVVNRNTRVTPPKPTPSKPAPAVSTPAPAPTSAPAPASPPTPGNGNGNGNGNANGNGNGNGNGVGHGNGNGGDDDPGNR